MFYERQRTVDTTLTAGTEDAETCSSVNIVFGPLTMSESGAPLAWLNVTYSLHQSVLRRASKHGLVAVI